MRGHDKNMNDVLLVAYCVRACVVTRPLVLLPYYVYSLLDYDVLLRSTKNP